ncbi:DUF4157 domain-containing protein [Aromatoleum toluclasticum]|uniref:eCIS core domain-containing protein n=1 Tax=Aromatoleum toluclasticum TaxID=92003 RepID=UPI001D1980EE|nr:DUF4157 domain-containing protein [Aromatoleum toluclasticum]MCC4113729.1 DUF4157 domain-containing protein [Aromatoleum toluclasticum]
MSSLAPGLRRKTAPEKQAPAAAPDAKPGGQKEPAGKTPSDQAAGANPQAPEAANQGGTPQEKRPGTPGYLQAKLAVSHPDDPAEKEADQVAGEVRRALRTPKDAGSGAQCSACSGAAPRGSLEPAITPPKKEVLAPRLLRAAATGEEEKTAATTVGGGDTAASAPGTEKSADTPKTAPGGADALAGQTAPAGTEQRVAARKGQGAPLDPELRAKLEAQLGRELSAVRIHTDAEADAMCVEMHARAFTVGNDVYFSAGSYAPESDAGLELLAHELTHVGQQAAAGGPQSAAPKLQRSWWDDLFGGGGAPADPMAACNKELGEAEKWAKAGPYPAAAQAMVGAGGRGGFDAQYKPDPVEGEGVLDIKQGVAVQFEDLLVTAGGVAAPNPLLGGTPELTALATRINGIPDAAQRATTLAAYQWNNAEQQPWIDDLKTLIESGWSGKHSFFLNKPRWNWLGASVAVKLDVGKRAQAASDHMLTRVYKMPSGEDLTSFGTVDSTNRGADADPRDQTMKLSKTGLEPNFYDTLRESVEFAHDSPVLDATAQTTLTNFIAKYNGAVANAAHQEIRVDIVGHTSGSGTASHNQTLSESRANAVRDFLTANGFANVPTRVHVAARGAAEADPLDKNKPKDRRVDLLVDGGQRQIGALHEWGHALGLGDEYTSAGTNIGDPTAHDAMVKAMTDASGGHLPGSIREHNGGIMSGGNEIRPQHYAPFHNALTTVTAQAPWSLGLHKPKWQVAMECGAPSPKGDWNLPNAPAPGTNPGTPPPGATPGSDNGSAVA